MKVTYKIVAVAVALIALTYSCTKDSDFWSSFIPETDEQPTATEINIQTGRGTGYGCLYQSIEGAGRIHGEEVRRPIGQATHIDNKQYR